MNLLLPVFILLIIGVFIYLFARGLMNGLPVLMYHKITDEAPPDFLTVSPLMFEKQVLHIIKRGYTTIFVSELIDHVVSGKALPRKPILLTFDDGYRNNLTKLYPLLRKYQLKANIFLVAGFIDPPGPCLPGHTDEYLSTKDTRELHPDYVQFSVHTYDHKSYADLSSVEIDRDLKMSVERLREQQISFQPCLAYTYGAYSKSDAVKRGEMFSVLQANGIQLAMRIGNRLNKLPIKNRYLVERIDIRGDESFLKFKLALKLGKKILFW